MKNTNKVILKNEYCLIKKAIEDDNGDIVWDVKDLKTNQFFVVHASYNGRMYVTHFKREHITKKCAILGITKICQILLSENITPTMRIVPKNVTLKICCTQVGFKPVKGAPGIYRLKNVKERNIYPEFEVAV